MAAGAVAQLHESCAVDGDNFTRAIDLNPKLDWALGDRGETYRLMGRYEEALVDFTRAIDLNPKYVGALASRGETYRLMGRYEEALADLTRAIDLNPEYDWRSPAGVRRTRRWGAMRRRWPT